MLCGQTIILKANHSVQVQIAQNIFNAKLFL